MNKRVFQYKCTLTYALTFSLIAMETSLFKEQIRVPEGNRAIRDHTGDGRIRATDTFKEQETGRIQTEETYIPTITFTAATAAAATATVSNAAVSNVKRLSMLEIGLSTELQLADGSSSSH